MLQCKRNTLIFISFFLLSFLLYYPAQYAKFVNDTFYYLYEIEKTGWKGLFKSYNMIFIWYIPSAGYYILYKLFGLNWFGWHVAFCLLHSLNAFLLYLLLKKIFFKQFYFQSILAALLFLISPFQTEVVAWGATLHYLLIVNFLLGGLFALWKYFETYKIKFLIIYHVSFLFSLSCFEQAFLYPFIFTFFIWFILADFISLDKKSIVIIFLKKFIVGNLISIFGYLLLTKYLFGAWIAHYGTSTHLSINITKLYSNLLNYNFKFLFYLRYLPDTFRNFFSNTYWQSIVLFVILFLLSVSIIRYSFNRKKWIAFFFLSYLFMLLPVLNLDNSFNFEIQSDRYGYIASLFFYPLLIIIMNTILSKRIFILFSSVEIIICIILLTKSVSLWHKSGDIAFSLLKTYPLRPDQASYILNLPDNYQGAYMFRNGFKEGLSLVNGCTKEYKTNYIAWVNVFSKNNETQTQKINDTVYEIKCTEIGKWYYYKGAGAIDYETGLYKVDFDEWNFSYKLTLKPKLCDNIYLLQCYGDRWKIIDKINSK